MLKPSVEVRNVDRVLVAEFWDCLRLDPNPVRDLRLKFEEHLRHGQRPDVVIDLNGVAFAGSAALGGFISLHRLASQKGGQVVFCQVDPNVFEVFRVSKLTGLFKFAADRDEALRQVDQPREALGTRPPSTPAPASDSAAHKAAPAARPAGGSGPLRRRSARDGSDGPS